MYRHSQPGTLIRVLLVISLLVVLFFIWLGFHQGQVPGVEREETVVTIVLLVFVALLMVVLLALFHNLTVFVDGDSVRFKFGIGLIGKKIPFEKIESCRAVTNSWVMGWGIRKISGGWLYNVSGLGAVELELKESGIIRIGTDEPEMLAAVVKERVAAFR